MKLFQIEEPEGAPLESDGPGAAVGIELPPSAGAAVAIAVGGNAEILPDADGALRLPLAEARRSDGAWHGPALVTLLLALRTRAERALARPVTHAVIALASPDEEACPVLAAAAEAAGLVLLRVMDAAEAAALAPGTAAEAAVLGAAIQAEDDAAGANGAG